LVTQREWST